MTEEVMDNVAVVSTQPLRQQEDSDMDPFGTRENDSRGQPPVTKTLISSYSHSLFATPRDEPGLGRQPADPNSAKVNAIANGMLAFGRMVAENMNHWAHEKSTSFAMGRQ